MFLFCSSCSFANCCLKVALEMTVVVSVAPVVVEVEVVVHSRACERQRRSHPLTP